MKHRITASVGICAVFLASLYPVNLAIATQPGSIVGWGSNSDGRATPPSETGFTTIDAGGWHSLALRADGSIVGWGYNGFGEATPPSETGFKAIAAGELHSLALRADGSIVGWGYNEFGQATPPSGTGFTAIAAGGHYSLALRADGSIAGWGQNQCGQATPPSGTGFTAIAAGRVHGLALRADGSIAGWGYNIDGLTTPPSGTGFTAIAAGYYHSLALKADGSIVGWGLNYDYPGGSNYVGQATPPSGTGFTAITAGYYHSLALKADGSIVGWGLNYSYPGGSYYVGQATPPSGTGFTAIAAGEDYGLAIEGPCMHVLAGDFNDDCTADFSDLTLMMSNWLTDCMVESANPACVPVPVTSEVVTLNSGVDTARFLRASGRSFDHVFTEADFLAAQAGQPAFPVTYGSPWVPNGSTSSAALWINCGESAYDIGSALYAVPFEITNTGHVDLDFYYAIDNGLGDPCNCGLFVNGTAISGTNSATSEEFGSVHSLSRDITEYVSAGLNYLYVYQYDWGVVSGSQFTAVITAFQRECSYTLAGDMNSDCRITLIDFAIMANNWLVDCMVTPTNPSCVSKP